MEPRTWTMISRYGMRLATEQLTSSRRKAVAWIQWSSCNHPQRGIHVTTCQPRLVAYLNSSSTSRCIIIDIVNLPMSWSIVAIRCQTPIRSFRPSWQHWSTTNRMNPTALQREPRRPGGPVPLVKAGSYRRAIQASNASPGNCRYGQ